MLASESNPQQDWEFLFNPNASFPHVSVFPKLTAALVTLINYWQDAAVCWDWFWLRRDGWLASRLNAEVNFLSQRALLCISIPAWLPTVTVTKAICSLGDIFLCQICLKLDNMFKSYWEQSDRKTDEQTMRLHKLCYLKETCLQTA